MIACLGANDWDKLPREATDAYLRAVERAALARIPIRTGASTGCDQAAASAALALSGRVELVLPWAAWQEEWVTRVRTAHPTRVKVEVLDPKRDVKWMQSVDQYAVSNVPLSAAKRMELARVYGIVERCEIVLALTLESERGGTGQGMRIARALGKVVLDPRHQEDRRQLQEWLLGLPQNRSRRRRPAK